MLSHSIDVIRLARLRYLALTIPPFATGVLGSPSSLSAYLWLGIGALILLRGISSIGNCLSDQVEDAIDHPERAALCDRVGPDRLALTAIVCGVLYLCLLAAMTLWLNIQVGAVALWLAFLFFKVIYSFGPRLKPRRHSATVLLGGVSGGMFFLGWIGGGLHDLQTGIGGAVFLWIIGASLCGSKDAPDVGGDSTVGYRSVYWEFVGNGRPLRRVLAVVSRPYLAVVLLAPLSLALGGPGLRLLWCLLAYPLGVTFSVIYVKANSTATRNLVREVGYLYWIIFMGIALICFVPTPTTAAIAAAGLVWYLLASLVAHPDPTPYGSDTPKIRSVLVSR